MDDARLSRRGSSMVDVGTRSIRGGAAVMAVQIASALIRIGSTAVLARLLLPEDFGLMAMVTAITVFAEGFKDLGLSDATVQKRDITHAQVSGLFWVNLCVCVAIAALLAGLSGAIAGFYREPRLIGIAMGIAPAFVFSGLTIQHQALLRRQMRFGAMAAIQISSTAFSIVVVVGLAFLGFGYWALVAKELSNAACTFALSWIICRWRPGLPRRGSGLSPLLSYGSHVTGFNVIVFLANSVDRVLLGRLTGPTQLGFYDNASKLVAMSVSQIRTPVNAVALPGLSALQEDPDRFRSYFQKITRGLTFFVPPIVVFFAVFADQIVAVLLGPRWDSVVPIFRALAIGAFVQPVVQLVSPALMAHGRTRQYFWLGVAGSAVQVTCVVGGGFLWGTLGVAMGTSASSVFACLLFGGVGLRSIRVTPSAILPGVGLDLLCALLWGGVLAAVRYAVGWSFGLAWLAVFAAGAAVSYVGMWLIVPGGRSRLLSYANSLGRVFATYRKAPGQD